MMLEQNDPTKPIHLTFEKKTKSVLKFIFSHTRTVSFNETGFYMEAFINAIMRSIKAAFNHHL